VEPNTKGQVWAGVRTSKSLQNYLFLETGNDQSAVLIGVTGAVQHMPSDGPLYQFLTSGPRPAQQRQKPLEQKITEVPQKQRGFRLLPKWLPYDHVYHKQITETEPTYSTCNCCVQDKHGNCKPKQYPYGRRTKAYAKGPKKHKARPSKARSKLLMDAGIAKQKAWKMKRKLHDEVSDYSFPYLCASTHAVTYHVI
jgi:hypothetical protein